jgi:putative membrane protein
LAVVIVTIVSFFALIAIRGYPTPPAGTYNGYPFMGDWFFWPFGVIFFFLFLFLIFRFVFGGWWGWGWRRRYWYGYGYGYGDAHEILRQRYARGEITKEQFDQMTRDLEQHK